MKVLIHRKIGFISIFLYLCIALSASSSRQETKYADEMKYPNIEAFKAELESNSLGIRALKRIDLNNDGKMDYLVYMTNYEDEFFSDVLVAKEDHLIRLDIPRGDSYEIIITQDGRYILRIGHFLTPGIGNLYSDCDIYLRYEHFEFVRDTMRFVNNKFPKFYEKMANIYRTRIKELEANIESNRNKVDNFREEIRINKYKELMKEAKEIANNYNKDYSELSMVSEDYKGLIKKYLPKHKILNIDDLSPSAKIYYENYIMNIGPSIICKDIDGNNLLDYALLLKDTISNKNRLLFVIFIQKKRGFYELGYKLDLDNPDRDLFLVPVAPDRDYNLSQMNPSVGLCHLNRPSASIFYWDEENRKIKESSIERYALLCR